MKRLWPLLVLLAVPACSKGTTMIRGESSRSRRSVPASGRESRNNEHEMMWGDRLSKQWIRFKAARWRACAEPAAVAAYVAMFARDGLPDPTARVTVPVLAITGEQDAEPMCRDAVTAALGPLCDNLVVDSLTDCGHYPMQEAPPLLVTLVQRFLAGEPEPTAATIAPRAAAVRV